LTERLPLENPRSAQFRKDKETGLILILSLFQALGFC
jgi:hypothetical protein